MIIPCLMTVSMSLTAKDSSSVSWASYEQIALHCGNVGFGLAGGFGLPPPGAGFICRVFSLCNLDECTIKIKRNVKNKINNLAYYYPFKL